MPIESTGKGGFLITGSASISLARLLVLRGGLSLEIKGMRMSRGRTAYSILKEELNLKGSKENVLVQVDVILDQMRTNPGVQNVQ